MEPFRACRVHEGPDGTGARLETLSLDELSPGGLVIRTGYSSINYKDALACTGRGAIMRRFPLVAGVDGAGVVVSSEDDRFRPGDGVLVTGCGIGEQHDGGYAEYMRVPADWAVPLPVSLSPKDAMIIGTAGFTAALALHRMEQNGQSPELGPVLVSGASGGVGSFAVALFSARGYEVHALTGKPDEADYLRGLGAAEVVDRNRVSFGSRPLEKGVWGGAVDNLGGECLGWLTRTTRPFGNIASIGLVAGSELHTTVMPFILRGVSLLGINSVNCPMPVRRTIWERLADQWRIDDLGRLQGGEVDLDGLLPAMDRMLEGRHRGRVLVRLAPD